jgi:tetratricopeptide (TPR) repeat protein
MRRLVLVASLLAGPIAHADRVTKPPVVELSERVKPLAHQDAPPPAKPATPDSIMESQLAAVPYREEQVELLRKLIASSPDTDPEKPDYYFRLGEIMASQQRVYRLQSAKSEIAGDKAAAKTAADKAHTFMIGAVGAYKELTDNDAFRNYPKMDLALFYYAYTLQQGGKYMKEARAVYDKLLKNYPSSKYVPEAHLAFADYYFEAGQLADAEARYKHVLEFPSSNAYWYAMYKLGWIDLNLAKHTEALDLFFKVANATKNSSKYDVLNRAAKKDFVRAYAEIGKTDKALDAFKRVDAKASFGMLETLADFYLEQGKSDKAIYVLRELMKLSPTSSHVCAWQYNVAHATLSLPGASNSDKVNEIVDLDRIYVAVGTKLPKSDADECRDNASAMAGELARAYHSEWSKTKSVDSFAAAQKLYKAYLSTFPKAADYAHTHYYFADLMWSRAEGEKDARLQTELWQQTGAEFIDVVKAGGLDAALTKEAAYAAVLAFLYAHDHDPRKPADAKPGEIPERDRKMLAAFDLYLSTVKDPKDDELVRIEFTKGNVLRRYGRYDQAIPIFKDLVAKHPEHELAEDAANLWLDSLNEEHAYAELVTAAHDIGANAKFIADKPKLQETVDGIEITSLRKLAEAIEKEARATHDFARLVDCGQAYLDIYNKNPEAKGNDQVLYNAGVCFEDGHSIGVAIRMYGLLQQYYPQSQLVPKAIARLGKAYGDIAFYDRAADQLEQYAKKYAGETDAHDAMNDAVLYRKGTGDDAKAIDDTKFFVRTFGAKNPAEAANADFALTSIFEKKGDRDAVIKHLREYIRTHGDKGGADKVVIAHARIGQLLYEDSCPAKAVDGACVKITRERAVATRGRLARLPTQCGPESKIKLTVIPRDSRKVRDALAELAAAEKHASKATTGDIAGVRYHLALGRSIEANVEYEKYLAMAFPENLDFDPHNKAVHDKSMARFDAWFAAKDKAGEAVSKKYVSVLELNDSANSIAARARLAQIAQNFSDELFTAEIPKDLRSGPYAEDKIEAYCDVLTTKAEPLAIAAVKNFDVCLAKSTELGWFSEWSHLCERELGQIKPEQYPTASERRADSDRFASVIALEGPPRL